MAKSVDKKQLQILIDTSEGVDKLEYLSQLYRRLGEEAKRTESAMTSRALLRQQAEQIDKIEEIRKELGLEGMTARQLQTLYREKSREQSVSHGKRKAEIKEERKDILELLQKEGEGLDRLSIKQRLQNKELSTALKANKLQGLSLDQLKRHHQNLTAQISASTAFESAANKLACFLVHPCSFRGLAVYWPL
jgi:hypothetical protein